MYRYEEEKIYTRAVWNIAAVLTAREHREYLAKSGPNRRREFLCGRICIKLALSDAFSEQYSFGDIEIAGSPGSKPLIKASGAPLAFDHSLSHSSGTILVAVSRSSQNHVGVDIEEFRNVKRSTYSFFLTVDEIQHIRSTSLQHQSALALRYWTIKEAALKAAGVGIAGNMKTIKVRSLTAFGAELELSREWLQNHPYLARQLSCHSKTNDKFVWSAITFAQ